jgi:hypothetical protein
LIFLFYILSFYFIYFLFHLFSPTHQRRILASVPERRRRRRRRLCSQTPVHARGGAESPDQDDAGRRSRGHATASEFFSKP